METYKGWQSVPEGLVTKTTLKKEGLRLARGQEHVAYCFTQYGSKRNKYKLYDKSQAIPAKPATEKQLEAAKKAQEASRAARTCKRCGYVEELSKHYRNKAYINRKTGRCDDCDREVRDTAAAIQWAKEVLASDAIILDCETVDLNDEIIELAIITMQGEVLFNRRFKPISKIADGATRVHGITAEMLEHEPSFAESEQELRTIFGKTSKVIIFNAAHDFACLKITRELHHVESFAIREKHSCAMKWYSQWRGRWNYEDRAYSWKPLWGGDHTALGDCRATLATIKEMAEDTDDLQLRSLLQ